MLSTERVRDRGRIVVVGDVGVELQRTPFYMKEIDLRFARSYGPGRYDRTYEEYSIDYPVGHVRWTEGRNIEAYLDMLSSGHLKVDDLITHTFGIDEAERAYATISDNPEALAVQFAYDGMDIARETIQLRDIVPGGQGAGIVGAGNYAKMTFLPAMRKAGLANAVAVTSSGGLTARHLAERHGVGSVVGDVSTMLAMPQVGTVYILSRHDSHAEITCAALDADKHVFVEKPLALSEEELDRVVAAAERSQRQLWVGFNRRHAEAVKQIKDTLSKSSGPLVLTYRVNAGRLPDTHWYRAAGCSARSATSLTLRAGSLANLPPESLRWRATAVRCSSRKTSRSCSVFQMDQLHQSPTLRMVIRQHPRSAWRSWVVGTQLSSTISRHSTSTAKMSSSLSPVRVTWRIWRRLDPSSKEPWLRSTRELANRRSRLRG